MARNMTKPSKNTCSRTKKTLRAFLSLMRGVMFSKHVKRGRVCLLIIKYEKGKWSRHVGCLSRPNPSDELYDY